MKAMKITKDKYHELLASGKPILLDFYADWCGPCRMVAPVIEEIAEERADLIVGKVNVDEEHELASAFGVMSIPTIVAMKGGREYRRATGARPKAAILSLLQ